MDRNGFSRVTPPSWTTTAGIQNSSQPRNAISSSGAVPARAAGPAVTAVTTMPRAATHQDSQANQAFVRALKISTVPACGAELMPPIIQYSEPQH